MNASRTRRDAESRLYTLHSNLNGNATPHDPTDAERSAAHARFFAEGAPANWQWPALGLTNLRPVVRTVADKAMLIVEAAHIRGWLRKLDACTANAAKAKKTAEVSRLRGKAESWPARESDLMAELLPLLEGEARHKERLEDERAFHRARELRRTLEGGRSEAVQVARSLGIAEPSAPEVEAALTI